MSWDVALSFQEYFGIFVASGKALNEVDMRKACMQWVSMTEPNQQGALQDARRTCILASGPHFVPFPINHLLSKPWTRRAMPRTLPTVTAREISQNERDEEASRLLTERVNGAS